MRFSALFTRTLREAPGDASALSQQLALRAGLIRPIESGSYALMPLGLRVRDRVYRQLRHELAQLDGQEIDLPYTQSDEVLYNSHHPSLQSFSSENERQIVMGGPHLEAVTRLVGAEINSYKQLPLLITHHGKQYRVPERPGGGLLRLREYHVHSSYAFAGSDEELTAFHERMVAVYRQIFTLAGLPVIEVQTADKGTAFILPDERGDDWYVECKGYVAALDEATFTLPPGITSTERAPLEKVATPGCATIEDVANYVGVDTRQTLKAVFFMHQLGEDEKLVFAVIRGDLEINDGKLLRVLGGRGSLRPASDAEIQAVGAMPGYASPIGLNVEQMHLVIDVSAQDGTNFVVGANEEGYHFTGANLGRDFEAPLLADIAQAFDGATCAQCADGKLKLKRGIELATCAQTGIRHTEPAGAAFLDMNGKQQTLLMAHYRLGFERLLSAIIATHHDDDGIIWPAAFAPFEIHMVTIGKKPATLQEAENIYDMLRSEGYAVLLDDRKESPGVKFADADLIGVPLRVTISDRTLKENGAEVVLRHQKERTVIPLAEVPAWVRTQLAAH
jgi:prolyl-tRNA synthetase